MAHDEKERKALGRRLAAARTLAGFTMEGAAKALTGLGYPVSKAGVGHWETGRNLPDALWLKRLAKLYNSTLDALVWDESVTMEAMQIAVQFDSLNESEKGRLRILWDGYVRAAADDATVEGRMPITKKTPSQQGDIISRSALTLDEAKPITPKRKAG